LRVDDQVNAVNVIVGFIIVLLGVVGLIRPDVYIAFRREWARLISRPFLHGRVLGGEVRTEDPFQRLVSRLAGTFFIIVGIGAVAAGLLANNE
jgi:multisubunit Na+/H+ antiporter MnhG subunit